MCTKVRKLGVDGAGSGAEGTDQRDKHQARLVELEQVLKIVGSAVMGLV